MKNNRKKAISRLNIIISLVIAFSAWMYVVYNFAPTKEVTYSNVPIEYFGEESLEYQGLQVRDVERKTINVTLDIDRKDYTKWTNDDINVKADVSQLVMGNNGVSLEIIIPDGTSMVEASDKSVSVQVGKLKSKE